MKDTHEKVLTQAEEIWNEIKDKSIDMFSLPNQKVSQYCQPKNIDPTKCFLVASSSSVLPSLEVAIGNKYSVEVMDKYLVVSHSVKFPFQK